MLDAKRPNQFRTSTKNLSLFARALGFEPRSKVLETFILPLKYARRKAPPNLPKGEAYEAI